MNPQIELEGISKVYTLDRNSADMPNGEGLVEPRSLQKTAVNNVTLRISEGTRLGIVGRNGAGKSTLLQIIAGLSEATSGTRSVRGTVTAVMTLGVGLREDLSGRENIYLDGEIQGKRRAEIDGFIQQIIDFAELGEFIDYPIRTYSTGMKARLAFSMLAHIEPEILIIDEALSAGDAAFAAKATAKIREICEKGKIVIVVSHSMPAILDICNRCLWMSEGRVILDGAPRIVTNAYIDAVRAEDERELLLKFGEQIGQRVFEPGWALEEIVLIAGDELEPRVLIESGARVRIQISGRVPLEAADALLQVRIMRLDDQLLVAENFPANEYCEGDVVGLEIEMPNMILGAAVYRLDGCLLRSNEVMAESSMVFEVMTRTPPKGGKPMLLTDVTAYVTEV